MYFRGGARMYANRTEDAAAFLTLADAQSAAEDLRKLLLHLPGRDYRVGTLQISRQKKKGGAA
jgi:hypothetical protein